MVSIGRYLLLLMIRSTRKRVWSGSNGATGAVDATGRLRGKVKPVCLGGHGALGAEYLYAPAAHLVTAGLKWPQGPILHPAPTAPTHATDDWGQPK